MNNFKRFLSLALAVLMTLSYAPTIAYATDFDSAIDLETVEEVVPAEDEVGDTSPDSVIGSDSTEEGGLVKEEIGDTVDPMAVEKREYYRISAAGDLAEVYAIVEKENCTAYIIALKNDIDFSGLTGTCEVNGETKTANIIIPEGHDVLIELDDNTLTGAILAPNATLTIEGGSIVNKDSSKSALEINAGTLNLTNVNIESARHAVRIDGDVTATINGGTYKCVPVSKGTYHAVNISGSAKVTIEDGTFVGPKDTQADSGSAVAFRGDSEVTINGGNFSGGKRTTLGISGKLVINGGNFTTGDDTQDLTEYVTEGKTIVVDNNEMLKNNGRLLKTADIVASIDDVKYTSLQEAVNAGKEGDIVVLTKDVEQEDGVIITDKNLTIDLNGKTFTVTIGTSTNNRNFKINGTSVVTIKNGTMVAKGDYSSGAYGTVRTEDTANVTLTDLKLYNYRGNGLNVKAYSGTTVTMTNVEVYSEYGGGIEAAGGTIELTEVKVEQKGMYTAPYNSMAISVNGGGKVTVNSGSYSTECIAATDANNQGTSHGPWVVGVLNSGGTLTIKGGTFSNDNFGDNSLATAARGAVLADTGAVINIEGGTFNALKGIIDIQNNLGDASKNPSGTISGGTFSADPTNGYVTVAKSFEVSQNEDGTYEITKVLPKGNDFTGYTSETAIWGETWGNAFESFVIKVLDAEGNVMGTTSLNNVGGIIDGDVYVTWSLKLDAESNTDEYWTMKWDTAPSIDNMPAKVELWVDGEKVSGGDVVLNGPDNLNPIYAATVDGSGDITGYYTTLANAVNAGDHVAILKAGTYSVPTGKDLTITGAVDGVVFECGQNNIGMNGASVTFNNVTFNWANNGWPYHGLAHCGEMEYNNCIFNGTVFLYGTSETFNSCEFNVTGDTYNVWTYGAEEVEFNKCTFNCDGKSVLIYSEDSTLFNEVTVTDCDFNASASVEGKAAIEMDSSLTAGISLTIDGETTATGFGTGNVSGNSLWNNKKGNEGKNNDITVVVANVTVLEPKGQAKIGDVLYSTISVALENAVAGNTVTILEGNYTLDLNVNKAITVVGETDEEGKNLVNITGKLNVTADGAIVKNINVNNGSDTAGYINAKDVRIEGCSVIGRNGFRYCYTNGTVTFKDSTITGSTYGIHFDGNAGGNIVIDNCVITGWTSFASTIEKVTIKNTTFAEGNYNKLRFYQDAELTDVVFNPKMNIDFGKENVSADFYNCSVSDNSALTEVIYLSDIVNMGIKVTVDGKPVTVVAGIGDTYYLDLAEALAAAAASGDTVTLLADVTEDVTTPAGITLNSNGFAIDGSLTAGGDLTIEGHLKVTSFSAGFYNHTITIGEGACLEVTGGDRVTIGWGNTFNITGSITDAKTTDKTEVQPSLIIPGGISITGSGATFNVTNAYIQLGLSTSKNSAATDTFDFDFTNSIVDFTNNFSFATFTSGKTPVFDIDVKDSVLNLEKNLDFSNAACDVLIDNSVVTVGSSMRNDGTLKLTNGSEFTVKAQIQSGEHGGNNGIITVDASTLTIECSSIGHAMDGNNVGKLEVVNGGEANIDYIIETEITIDTESSMTANQIKDSDIIVDAKNFAKLKAEVLTLATALTDEQVVNINVINNNRASVEAGNVEEKYVITVKQSAVAKVGNDEYATIDDAIAAWTSGTTLTLLADVTLSDVITLKSTEHHILNLGTYTMTAADGKNAIVIQACGTGDAERSALTINADAANPGGINAGKKCVIYYKYADGGISTNDRPIIKINGGVFTGATSYYGTAGIYTIGTAARKCATLDISGGTFNCSIYGSSKSKLRISGGTFNYYVGSQGDSTANRQISGGTFKTIGFMTADAANKFWFGTSEANYNVGVYVDDNGYLVVGGAVITEAGDKFEASSTNYGGWSSYLQYSSAKDNGLYYTSVEEALADNNKTTGAVTVYTDEIDLTSLNYKGTIQITKDTLTVTFAVGTTPAWTVESSAEGETVTYTDTVEDGVVTRTYTAFVPVAKIVKDEDTQYFETLAKALTAANDGDTVELIGSDPIAMNGAVYGKTVTITGTATVDWSKGFLFIGRGGEGNGTVIFDNANLTSASNSASYGIHVSGREKGTTDKYDGTLIIKNSTIVLDYLINKGTMTLDNSTLTVKNGFSVGGRPASETESGEDATATITLNNSKLVVNNHNGMGLGYEAIGIMNVNSGSTFETTQSFLVTAKGTMNVNGGTVKVTGTLTNDGTVNVTGASDIEAKVTGTGWVYMNSVTLDADTKLYGAKVRFASGTNNIDGSIIDDGFFQVGIGAYNGVDANVDTANGVIVNVKNATIGSSGSTYAGWIGTGFYDTDDEKAEAMTDAKYVLNIENSIAEFGYLHISNDGELNVKGNAATKAHYNNSDYSFYAGDFIINGTATFDATDVLALYTKVSCDNGTATPGTLNIVNETYYEAERHNGAIAGTNFILYKTGVVNVDKATLYIGEYTSIAADAEFNIGGTVTALGNITNNGTITLTDKDATLTTPEAPEVVSGLEDYKVKYEDGAYKLVEKVYVAQIGDVKYENFEDALAAACEDKTITEIKVLRDFSINEVKNTENYYDITQALTITAEQKVTVTGAGFAIRVKGEGAKLTIHENVTIEGLDVVANGFGTTGENMVIEGTLKALTLKQWTSNGTITVTETGSVWLGYGDGQFDLAFGNGTVTINGTGDKTISQFKAGYSGTRGNGNTLNLNDTYFEAGAWFNLNGSNGTINVVNSLLKVSGGDSIGKLTIASSGNKINLTKGSELAVATITLGEGNTISLDASSKITATTLTGAGTIVIDATGMTAGEYANISADVSGFTGTIEVINNPALIAKVENGRIILVNAVASIGNKGYATLAEAIAAVKDGETITLLAACAEDVTIKQVEGVNITIDGNGNTYSGTITVDGQSKRYESAGLTIKNFKFDATNISKDASINLGGNNNMRYTSNVTVEKCTFTGTYKTDGVEKVGIKQYTGGCHNLKIIDCTADNMHSLVQLKNVEKGLEITGCEITNSKNGISIGASSGVVISGCEITADGYGIRADGSGAYTATITDCTISANDPVVVRKATGTYVLTLTGNNALTTNIENGYQVTFTNGDDGTYEKPNGKFTLNGGGDLKVYPTSDYVATINEEGYFTLAEAFEAAKNGDTVTVLAEAKESILNVPANVTLNLNGHYLTASNVLSFGNIIDKNAEGIDGLGGIKISNDSSKAITHLQTGNTYLPLYDAENGCYRFFEYNFTVLKYEVVDETKDSVKFRFRLRLSSAEAYKLLAKNDCGVQLSAQVSWNGMNSAAISFVLSESALESYAEGALVDISNGKDPLTIGSTINLTLSGLTSLGNGTKLTVLPTVTSETGVYNQKRAVDNYSIYVVDVPAPSTSNP